MNYTSKRIVFSSDELNLVGYIYLPEINGNFPSILFLHGAGVSSSQRFKLWQPHLAECGIASFAFDYRGCGESEGEFEESSLQNRLLDAVNSLKVFIDSGGNKENMTVLGASMSGHVAVRLVEKYPWIKAIMLQCAAAYGTEAEDKLLNESFTQIIRGENNWVNSPAFKILEDYPGKVYTFYGDNDDVIPKGVQERYNQIANKKGQAVILPHATHTLLQPKNKLQEEAMYKMYDLSVEFLQQT